MSTIPRHDFRRLFHLALFRLGQPRVAMLVVVALAYVVKDETPTCPGT